MDALVFILEQPYLYETIKAYDTFYKVVIINKKSKADRQELKNVFDEIIEVSNVHNKFETDKAISVIIAKRKVKAVYGSYESVLEVAGRLRSKFNIPGMTEEETLKVRNKALMKTVMKQNAIATADFKVVKTLTDHLKFLGTLNKPVVIKPVNGFATKYTYKIDGFQDLLKVKTLKAMFRHKTFLAESFVDGEEYHCDSVVLNGKVVFSSVAKYLNNCLSTIDFKAPSGSIFYPATCDNDAIISRVKSLNEATVKALNIQNAVCHMEAFIDKQGCAIFGEITPRIGGSPHMPECIKNIYGVDLHKAFVDLEIHNYKSQIKPKPLFTGWISFPSKQGIVTKISNEADFFDVEGVVKVKIYNKIGDKISRRKNTTIRSGYIIMENSDHDQLLKKLYDAYNRFQLKVK